MVRLDRLDKINPFSLQWDLTSYTDYIIKNFNDDRKLKELAFSIYDFNLDKKISEHDMFKLLELCSASKIPNNSKE